VGGEREIDLTVADVGHAIASLPLSAIDGLFDSVVLASPVRATDGRIIDFLVNHANESTRDVAGRSRAHLEGHSFLQLWPRLEGRELWRGAVLVAENGGSYTSENYEYIDTIDGRVVREIFDIRFTKLGEEMLVAWRIVTDHVDRDWELRAHQHALEEAQRIGHLGTWFWDATSDDVVWSPEVYRIYGIPEGTPLRSSDSAAGLGDANAPLMERTLQAARRGESIGFEQQIMRPDGSRRINDIRAEPVLGRNRKLRGIRGTTRDVTELRTVERALARERAAVEVLQGSILRRGFPDIPAVEMAARYLPAASDVGIGGDWYDGFCLPDGRLALTIGDVVGHGVRAAELMGQLRNGLRMAVLSAQDPAAAIRQVDMLIAQTLPGAFATALVAILEPATGRFTWSRAGHTPPAIRRADGAVDLPECGGRCPLGVEWEKPNVNAEITLARGDAVVLYTDGLIERRGERLDLGLDRLADALAGAPPSPDELCDAALRECLLSGADADDVCVMAVVRR
jgi:serine phosphatase RsbU (regulator of sigma subunit)/PAS domain-containing protein